MDDDRNTDNRRTAGWKRWAAAAALVGGGVVAGGLAASMLSANAEDSGTGVDATRQAVADWGGSPESVHPDERLLKGDTADRVERAALAEYPDATVVRIETDSDGVYEAHLTTADGQPLAVEVDKSFTVTGTESFGPGEFPHGGVPHAGSQP